ncbi:MAG: ComEC/Rec2 family competence protein [Saprospiraceae bacterium]|nr:ComEC/Rec2 family competence protein [Saprospiraceae bacterium]
MLCLQPGFLFDVGFQLSYLAVIGIVYFHPKIYALWYIENRIGDYLWQLTALSLAATLTTFPLSLLYFHQFPAYFWLSGLVAVPAAALILGGGLLLLAVHSVPLLGMLVGKLLYGVIWLMNASIFLIQQLPGSRISGIWIGAGTAVLLYAVLAAAALAISSRRFRWVLVALAGGVLIGAVGLWEQWKAHQRQEIVLYHTRRQTAIDFFDGKRVFTLSGNTLTEEDHTFALQNYRWYARSRPQGAWLLHESPAPADRWFYRNGLARFHDVRLAVMNRPLPANQSVTADYLLIRDNPRQSMEELTAGWTISSRMVLFDASNSRRRASRWMAECESLGLNCYDVEQNGAFVLNLRKNRK